MTEVPAPIEIPDRPLFKPAEVCELLKLQPYVLRSWEAEFPALGVAKGTGTQRVYRRGDVEQVMKIRHLLLVEGLTLAGARRRIEDEAPATVADERVVRPSLGADVLQRIADVSAGLRGLREMLDRRRSPSDFALAPPVPNAEASAALARRRGDDKPQRSRRPNRSA